MRVKIPALLSFTIILLLISKKQHQPNVSDGSWFKAKRKLEDPVKISVKRRYISS